MKFYNRYFKKYNEKIIKIINNINFLKRITIYF